MKNVSSVSRVSFFSTVGLMSLALLFGSCKKSENGGGSNTPAAGIMAFNLAPDQPAVTIGISGSVLTNGALGYTNYTGGYLGIYPGSRSVDAYDPNNAAPFASTPFNFEADKFYSSFVIGVAGSYKNVVVEDDFDSLTVANGQAYVRYINAIPDSSAPTVVISSNGAEVVNRPAIYSSVSGFSAVTPGDININVSNGGTVNTNRTINLETKKAYTVLLIGKTGSTIGAADSIQIKFVANGTLSDSVGAGGMGVIQPKVISLN